MTPSPEINRPRTLAEVRTAFEDYERALLDNNLPVLDGYFWEHTATVRYGVAENLQGAEEIASYRRQCQPVGPGRKLFDTVITTFGDDCATVSTRFHDGVTERVGRQMQTWVRFADGWKIVAAHVSVDLSTL